MFGSVGQVSFFLLANTWMCRRCCLIDILRLYTLLEVLKARMNQRYPGISSSLSLSLLASPLLCEAHLFCCLCWLFCRTNPGLRIWSLCGGCCSSSERACWEGKFRIPGFTLWNRFLVLYCWKLENKRKGELCKKI